MSSKANVNHQLHSAPETVEPAIDQIRQENSELHNKIEILEQENSLLTEVISTVGSTLRLDEVLHLLVDTVVRATSCQVAFIYLYDKDQERLVLAGTSEQYQHLVGKISLALGEGIAGWVALHQKPIFLKEGALEDPRFYYFPELEEEKFQSIMTVPIVVKDRRLVGVINVQAVAPHEFTKEHRTFISNAAALVGGAIENAQLYENTQRKLNILTSLSALSQTINSGLYLDAMLRSLATLTIQIMEVDLVVIMLMEQARERDGETTKQQRRLVVRTTAPNLNERAHFHPIDVDQHTLEHLQHVHELNEDALTRFNPLQDSQYKTLLSAPLVAGTEQLGLINCYSSKTRRFTPEDQTLLLTIANQVAIAIKNSYLVNQLAQRNLVKGFFDDLMQGGNDTEESLRQRAHFLGCDLSRPHAAVMVEIAHVGGHRGGILARKGQDLPTRPHSSGPSNEAGGQTQGAALQSLYKQIGGMIRRRIQDSQPGSLFYEHENLLTCIIPLSKTPNGARLKTWLQELSEQMHHEYSVYLATGIGNTCQLISDYRRSFAEAKEALQMGQNLNQGKEEEMKPVVTHFNDLGVYRYLYKIAHMDDLRDVYQEQIERIHQYDRRKNTDLVDTLETYLECAGNLTKTSERLFVHRNTLIQRLERLQSLCDIDLQERANWLTLQVAIKIFKLRGDNSN